jgi:hypothetical protein
MQERLKTFSYLPGYVLRLAFSVLRVSCYPGHASAPSVTGIGPTLNIMKKQNTSISQLYLKLLHVQHLIFYIMTLNKNYVKNIRKGLFSYSAIGFQGTNI